MNGLAARLARAEAELDRLEAVADDSRCLIILPVKSGEAEPGTCLVIRGPGKSEFVARDERWKYPEVQEWPEDEPTITELFGQMHLPEDPDDQELWPKED